MQENTLRFMIFVAIAFVCNAAQAGTFTNPIAPAESPDPWMGYVNGQYYYTKTTGGGIDLWRNPQIEKAPSGEHITAWSAPNNGIVDNVWAPEFHKINGIWYAYACGNTLSGNFAMRVFVLKGGANIWGPYTFMGIVNGINGIDPTEFQGRDGVNYLVWSEFESIGQTIRIAPLTNPWTIDQSKIVRISSPIYDWEKQDGNGGTSRWVNEGPFFMQHGGADIINYSASGCETRFYSLGQLVNRTANYLDSASWQKSDHPVFQQSEVTHVYGVGHHAITTSPDGSESWIVYHGKSGAANTNGDRSTRAQKFTWNADDTPNFGEPVASGAVIDEPSTAVVTPHLPAVQQNDLVQGVTEWSWPFSGSTLPAYTFPAQDSGFIASVSTPANSPATGFALRIETWIDIPSSGVWNFRLTSDDGSRLSIDSTPIINNDGIHGMTAVVDSVNLDSGLHKVLVDYFQNDGGDGLTLEWSGPGVHWQLVPQANLWRVNRFHIPYKGPIAIPGILEFENFDFGGEGVAYHDSDAINQGGAYRIRENVDIEANDSGFAVGWTNGGEWLGYTVQVADSGNYALDLRASAPAAAAGAIQLKLDGKVVGGPYSIASTFGWNTYAHQVLDTLKLNAGTHILVVKELTGGFNLDRMRFTKVTFIVIPTALKVITSKPRNEPWSRVYLFDLLGRFIP